MYGCPLPGSRSPQAQKSNTHICLVAPMAAKVCIVISIRHEAHAGGFSKDTWRPLENCQTRQLQTENQVHELLQTGVFVFLWRSPTPTKCQLCPKRARISRMEPLGLADDNKRPQEPSKLGLQQIPRLAAATGRLDVNRGRATLRVYTQQ